jgi:hypothetical protein
MHDYQRKRLAEFAIHKCFILNDMFLAVWEEQEPKEKISVGGKKSGSKLPHSTRSFIQG